AGAGEGRARGADVGSVACAPHPEERPKAASRRMRPERSGRLLLRDAPTRKAWALLRMRRKGPVFGGTEEHAMTNSRRHLPTAPAAAAVGALVPAVSRAQGAAVTPDLIAAAQKEGKVVWYTSVDLAVAEKIGRAFETKYPGVACRVERSGAERNFQRI